MDPVARTCFLLGLPVEYDTFESSNCSTDAYTAATFLEISRRASRIIRHAQLLQMFKFSSIAAIISSEWVFCRLQFNDVSEVIEYIDFSKMTNGSTGLEDIRNLLENLNEAEKFIPHSPSSSEIKCMYSHSCYDSEHHECSLPSIGDKQDFSTVLFSMFF
jgi:hypothetical protein